jgi:hypothetical protein
MRVVLLSIVILTAHAPAHARQNATVAAAADSRDANLRAYVELLRSDLRTQKVAILTEMMHFTESEDRAFWPIYREYEVELARINDQRIAVIKEYAAAYTAMTDAAADRMATVALDLEGRRHALKAKYYARLKEAMPAITVARFLQVENQILLLLDLQIAASLPVVR